MLKDLPEDVRMAFNILYNFADDCDVGRITKDGANFYGYDIDGQTAHYIRLAISKNRTWEDVV